MRETGRLGVELATLLDARISVRDARLLELDALIGAAEAAAVPSPPAPSWRRCLDCGAADSRDAEHRSGCPKRRARAMFWADLRLLIERARA